jgi:hypothetical protein
MMSNKKNSKISRKERRWQEVEGRRRQRLLRIGILVIILVILIGVVIFRTTSISVAGVLDFGPQERGHDANALLDSGELPPVGGVHDPIWQNCGIYDQPVDPARAVHSMEHGAVWITYHPEIPEEGVSILQDQVRGQSYLLTSPYPDLKSEVVLTAWGVQLEVDSVNDERIGQFIDQYRLGPQTPEFGAACTDGAGTPIG